MLRFVGIGAQKSGTTWLYEMLRLNPELSFPAGKEVHHWDRPPVRTLEEYKDLFNTDGICGEITPAYSFLPIETIGEIFKHFPDLRIIYLMRNPIERAWSSSRMALSRAEMLPIEASDQWFIDHFNSAGSLARGDYQKCIQNWRLFYPRSSIALYRYEQILNEPRQLLKAVCDHIGANSHYVDGLDDQTLKQQIFKSIEIPLRESLKPELRRLYQDKIQNLSTYLSEDLTAWQI